MHMCMCVLMHMCERHVCSHVYKGVQRMEMRGPKAFE